MGIGVLNYIVCEKTPITVWQPKLKLEIILLVLKFCLWGYRCLIQRKWNFHGSCFRLSPTKWNFAHNQLKFFMDLKNAMKNTWICLEHFHGSLKTACTMPWKNSWTAAWGHTGIFSIFKNPCQHFQPVLESVSMVSNGGNCLDIKAQLYPQYLKIINLP